jgi:hypothetical protein
MRKSILPLSLTLLLIGVSLALATEKPSSKGGSEFMLAISVALFSGLIGYGVGVLKAFREYKQKVYQEILLPILTMVYKTKRGEQEEREFNQSLSKLWLYANKDVAKKTDRAVSIIHKPSRGDLTKALQEVIAAMRKDIQIWPWQKLDPSEVTHLYSQLSGQKKDDGSI